jgi:WD40 repeat protein
MLPRFALALVTGFVLAPFLRGQPPAKPRTDALSDPLPAGAVARLGTLRLKHQPDLDPTVDAALFSPDGKWICSWVHSRASVRLWDAATGKEVPGPWSADDTKYAAIAFSPDSTMLAAAGTINSKSKEAKDDKQPEGPLSSVILVWNIADGKQRQMLSHQGPPARVVVFGAGGKTLHCASDGVFRWFDLDTGKEERTWKPFAGDQQPAEGGGMKTKSFANCAISPDGKFAAVEVNWGNKNKGGQGEVMKKNAPIDYEAIGFDLTTTKITWRAFAKAPQGNKVSFAYSADSKRVAVAIAPNQVEVRAALTGKLVGLPPLEAATHRTDRIGGLGLSPDGATLAIAGKDSHIVLWSPDSAAPFRTFSGRMAQFWDRSTQFLTFSPNGKTLLVGGDADLQLYDVATLKEVREWEGHRGWVDQLAFSADGKRLLTGSAWFNPRLQEVLTWDVATWKQVQLTSVRTGPWPNVGNPSLENSVYVGKTGEDRFALFDRGSGKLLARLSVPDKQPVAARGFFSPDGKFFMLAGKDGKGKNVEHLFAVPTGKLLCQLPPLAEAPTMSSARHAAFSADARLVAVFCREDGHIHVVETATGKVIHALGIRTVPFQDERAELTVSLAFSHNGKWLASWSTGDQVVRIWDLTTGKDSMQLLPEVARTPAKPGVIGHANNAVQFAWSPDGRLLAVGESKIRVVEVATLKVRHELAGHDGPVRALAFSPDSRLLASGSADTTILIWDALNFDQPATFAQALPPADLEQLWETLLKDDAAKAFAAIRALSAAPSDAVAWIQAKVKPAATVDGKLVDALIGQLDDSQYKVRQKATAELVKIGEQILPRIEKVLAGTPPLEVRMRLEEIRNRMTVLVLTGEKLQAFRAVEILERIATPQASKALEALANGAPATGLTIQAQEAFERLRKS